MRFRWFDGNVSCPYHLARIVRVLVDEVLALQRGNLSKVSSVGEKNNRKCPHHEYYNLAADRFWGQDRDRVVVAAVYGPRRNMDILLLGKPQDLTSEIGGQGGGGRARRGGAIMVARARR